MIETIVTALAFGTFWFWFLVVIASTIIIACVENEHYPTPSIVAIILGLIYWKPLLALPWQTIAIGIAAFALLGVLWSAFKWFRFVNRKTAEVREEHGNSITQENLNDLKREVSLSRHKAMITGWIAFWPWSVAWSLTGDFFNMLYDAMVNVYQKISDRALGKFQVVEPEKKKEVITNDGFGAYRR